MKKIELKKLINNNPWFARYYDFDKLNIIGLRDNKQREEIYNKYDFSEKNILDVGCNLGKNFLFLSKKNPKKLVGVDLEYTINVAKKIQDFYEIKNLEFYPSNLNNPNWFENLKTKSKISNYDYSLFVSVYGTKELKNRDGILKDLIKNTKDTIFFEGHNLENHFNYSKILLKNEVKSFYFHGYLRDKENDFTSNIRPFFTISNKDFSKEEIIKKIKEIQEKKGRVVIGIEGLAGAGKTTFTKELISNINSENITFVDDLKDVNGNCYKPTNCFLKILFFKIISFCKNKLNLKPICNSLNHLVYNKTYDIVIVCDYKLRKYVNHVDILINIETKNRDERLKNRENKTSKDFNSKKVKSKNFSCDYFFTLENE